MSGVTMRCGTWVEPDRWLFIVNMVVNDIGRRARPGWMLNGGVQEKLGMPSRAKGLVISYVL